MPTDPTAPLPLDTPARQAQRIADLERRLAQLERTVAKVAGVYTDTAGALQYRGPSTLTQIAPP